MGIPVHLSTYPQLRKPLILLGLWSFFALPFASFLCYNCSQAYEDFHTISSVLERGFIYVNDSVKKRLPTQPH